MTTDHIGDDLTPCPVWEYKNSLDERFVIINTPNVTLRSKFIEPDPSDPACVNLNGKPFIQHWANKIHSEDSVPNSRFKPVFATVAGKGKGKTRFLVEITKALHMNHLAFALPITFNNNTPNRKDAFGQTGPFAYAYEVVWRMLSSAYRIDERTYFWKSLESAIAATEEKFRLKWDPIGCAQSLIRGCIQFLMTQYLIRHPALKDKKSMFVLLMDESMHIN